MPISNCMRCGSIFSRVDKLICPECLKKEEENFGKAMEWLRDNPGKNIQALCEATGIDRQNILRWIRENRIATTEPSDMVRCKKCGAPISAGNLCDQCKLGFANKVTKNPKTTGRPPQPISKEGMHYLPSGRQRRRSS